MGISVPVSERRHSAQFFIPSIARMISTFESLTGLPPSLAAWVASSSIRPAIISAVFSNIAILLCFGSQFFRLRNN